MTTNRSECSVCERDFTVRFRFQVREEAGAFLYICSQACLQTRLTQNGCVCSVCNTGFKAEYPWQMVAGDGSDKRFYCSQKCVGRDQTEHSASGSVAALPQEEPRRIAVFNHKGGTGKTTTAVNLAAGMAERGKKVLLVDADGQGNVGASLGIRGEKSLYHVLVHGASPEEVAIPVRSNLDVITSNETLAAAELYLAGRPNRDRIMRSRLGQCTANYDMVVIDCAPALSLMNQNALVFADNVLIPVACDYLSLVGVSQVLKTIKNVRQLLRHDVKLLGVLPTFYDRRAKISIEALAALRKHFGERCLTPVRVNTRLREAPSVKQTIFEFAPGSSGANDYLTLVDYIWGIDSHNGVASGGEAAKETSATHVA